MAKWKVTFTLEAECDGDDRDAAIENFGLRLDDALVWGEWRDCLQVTEKQGED